MLLLLTPRHVSVLESGAFKCDSSNLMSFSLSRLFFPRALLGHRRRRRRRRHLRPLSLSLLLGPSTPSPAKTDPGAPRSWSSLLPLEDLFLSIRFLDIAVFQPFYVVCGGWKRDLGKRLMTCLGVLTSPTTLARETFDGLFSLRKHSSSFTRPNHSRPWQQQLRNPSFAFAPGYLQRKYPQEQRQDYQQWSLCSMFHEVQPQIFYRTAAI